MKKNLILLLALCLTFYGQVFCQNMVTNGGFTAGNTGFLISNELPNNFVCDPGSYAVVNNTAAQKCPGIFSPLPGIGDNSYLVIDGFVTNPSRSIIWEQSIPVSNGALYSFGFSVAGVTNSSKPNLEVKINGHILLNIANNNVSFNNWTRFSSSWVADASTATIEIRQLAPYSSSGYDYALDHIVFEAGCAAALNADFSYEFNPCTGVVNFFAKDQNATSWSWDFGDGTTSTLQNPTHVFTNGPLPTGSNGAGIWLTVGDGNQCLAAVHASDLHFYKKDSGLSGINRYTNATSSVYQYDADINESNIYTGSGSSYCRTDFPQVTRGASTMDEFGNYYYLEGNNISRVDELPCNTLGPNLTYSNINGTGVYEDLNAYPFLAEPEYGLGGKIWILSYNSNGDYELKEISPSYAEIQNSSEESRVTNTIAIGQFPHIEGSSTFDPINGKYYYVLDAPLPASNNDNPIIGTIVEIDINTATVRTFNVRDMDGVNGAGTPYRLASTASITPVLQELEYNSTNGKILATVEHYIEEVKVIYTTPGGGNPNGDGLTNGGELDGHGNGNNDNGPLVALNYKITAVSTDVIRFTVPNGNTANASIAASNVSYDNYSSSTFDINGQRYLLTTNNGSSLQQVDLSAGVVSIQTGASPTNAKDGRLIYEIEFRNCGASVSTNNRTVAKTTSIRPSQLNKTTTSTVKLDDKGSSFGTSIYPNPTSTGIFTLNIDDFEKNSNLLVEVVDVYGKVLQQIQLKGTTTDINILDFAKGLYFLKISSGDKLEVKKLIYR